VSRTGADCFSQWKKLKYKPAKGKQKKKFFEPEEDAIILKMLEGCVGGVVEADWGVFAKIERKIWEDLGKIRSSDAIRKRWTGVLKRGQVDE
jgi:hypothetical protein